ncbi:putative uncharacterized protein CXorf58, partial [Galemys pyrenaicus]
ESTTQRPHPPTAGCHASARLPPAQSRRVNEPRDQETSSPEAAKAPRRHEPGPQKDPGDLGGGSGGVTPALAPPTTKRRLRRPERALILHTATGPRLNSENWAGSGVAEPQGVAPGAASKRKPRLPGGAPRRLLGGGKAPAQCGRPSGRGEGGAERRAARRWEPAFAAVIGRREAGNPVLRGHREGALGRPREASNASRPEAVEYFTVRKMNPIAKTSLTSILKSNTPQLTKEHEVDSSSSVKINPEQLMTRDKAAKTIQRAWLSYTNKMVFQLLKHTICAAEFNVTHEILKKVSPSEAELIKDPSMKHKVRFRFNGETFPPYIVFKIFVHTKGHGYKYFSGKNLLKSSTEVMFYDVYFMTFLNLALNGRCLRKNILAIGEQTFFKPLSQMGSEPAPTDVYRLVGKKKFYNQFLEDERPNQKIKISDEIDVITIRDYMQYSSFLDDIPASSGGKNNYWRRLNLENIPKAMLMYDIVDFVQSGVISTRLRKELKYLSQRPKTEEMRQHQLRIVSEVRHPSSSHSRVQPLSQQQQSQVKHLGSSSKQTETKSDKMKKTNKMAEEKNAPVDTEQPKKTPKKKQRKVVFSTPSLDVVKVNELSSDDDMEKEEKMFSWCQDTNVGTTRENTKEKATTEGRHLSTPSFDVKVNELSSDHEIEKEEELFS